MSIVSTDPKTLEKIEEISRVQKLTITDPKTEFLVFRFREKNLERLSTAQRAAIYAEVQSQVAKVHPGLRVMIVPENVEITCVIGCNSFGGMSKQKTE